MKTLKIEKLKKEDFEQNKCFCRPKKIFKSRKVFPKVDVQILEGLADPKTLLER